MRNDTVIAVGELHRAIGAEHWQGKRYRQFWTWFNARCIEIVGQADSADLDALGAALLDVREAVEASGYLVASDQLDEMIEADA